MLALFVLGCTAEQQDAPQRPDVEMNISTTGEDMGVIRDMDASQGNMSAAAEWPVDQAGQHVLTLQYGESAREVRLLVPDAPLRGTLLLLHGATQTAASFVQKRAAFIQLAQEQGWVVIVPMATLREGKTNWNYHLEAGRADDTAFIISLLDHQEAHGVSGPAFIAGFSNGGQMIHSLIAQHPERFTAAGIIASNIGTYAATAEMTDRIAPTPSGPIALWIANGSQDPSIPYDGGIDEAGRRSSVAEVLERWTSANSCQGAPLREDLAERAGFRRTWTMCADGAPVIHVSYASDAHAWPEDGEIQGWSANQELLDFFLAHKP